MKNNNIVFHIVSKNTVWNSGNVLFLACSSTFVSFLYLRKTLNIVRTINVENTFRWIALDLLFVPGQQPGCVLWSVALLTEESEGLGSITGPATYLRGN